MNLIEIEQKIVNFQKQLIDFEKWKNLKEKLMKYPKSICQIQNCENLVYAISKDRNTFWCESCYLNWKDFVVQKKPEYKVIEGTQEIAVTHKIMALEFDIIGSNDMEI